MGRLLASIFGLRREERELALLMALYHFLLLITLYLLKPVRDSLFLSERGAAELPFVFILTTVAVVPVVALQARAGRTFKIGRLIDGGSMLLIACLVGLRFLLGVESTWTAYVLYAWVSIYGLLVTSQFWLLANAVFTASQAKRVFTALSVGAILGAVAGGEITGLLVDVLGLDSANLLWVTAGVLGASIVLVRAIRYRHREQGGRLDRRSDEPDDPRQAQGALHIIRSSRHIQLIVGVIALTVITTTFVDYQFKTVAAAAYPSESALTAFMGRFYGRVSMVALLVQFVVAPRLMRVVGIGGALSILPAALALGTLGMIAVPGLAAGVLLRGTDQSLKHSIDKTGRELLFVPVSLEKKKRVKVFLDLFVDQGAQGVGGALLLLFAYTLGFSVQELAGVTLVFLCVWGFLAYRARHSYVDQFRRKLRKQEDYPGGEADRDEVAEETLMDDDLDEILKSLCSHSETEALQALEMLEAEDVTVPVDALRCLLSHPAAPVRKHAVRVLRVRGVDADGVATDVAELLTDTDPDVQLAAARYLYCNQTENRIGRLREGLSHEDPRIRAVAVGLVADMGGPREYRLITEPMLRRLVEDDGRVDGDARTHVARLLGVLDRPYRNDLLRQLLHDDDPQVVREAMQSAGETGDRAFVHTLLRRLADDTYESAARQALGAYGRRILGTLHDHLVDPNEDPTVRRRIPSILAESPCQMAVTALVRALDAVPIPVRHAVVRALSKLHAANGYRFDAETVEAAVRAEAEHFAALGQILHLSERTQRADEQVSPDALRSFREESLERIFRLLGMRYDQRDIYDAYLGITSADPSLRASAVEFVDNLVDYGISKYLLPLLDDGDGREARAAGPRLLDVSISDWSSARAYLRDADDTRLTALADGTEGAQIPDRLPGRGDGAPEGGAGENKPLVGASRASAASENAVQEGR